ncbi:MAG TPA: Crp/Fnr family transcriptional regulator [Solirubrobacteraceae bacterium]|jgi:CRP-like cAMP-binding protein|nr:Crp/Fnr family transcriptional regulator [Solirubrobacteraceae bacterium]
MDTDTLVPGTFLTVLDEGERAALAELGIVRRFPRGALLMFEHEPSERVMILVSGRVKVSRLNEDGHELLLSIRDPGDVLGELGFLDGDPRIASIAALEPVSALVVPSAAFRAHLESAPRVAVALLEVVIRRFRDTTVKRAQSSAADTMGRVAARILELCDRYGTQVGEEIEVATPLSQDELAAWTGSSRAGVALALQRMRELGWIRTQRRRIVVSDPGALRARAADGS